jgi:hypothetical protein
MSASSHLGKRGSLLRRSLAPAIAALAAACASPTSTQRAADGATAEYSVHDRMVILKPVSLEAMNHESQSAVLVQDVGDAVVVDVTYFPKRGPQSVGENPTWRADNAATMSAFLQPGVTANWDESMRADLLAALAQDGIDPGRLTDKELVLRVSKWLVRNFTDRAPFVTYYTSFDGGRPFVKPEFRAAFDAEKTKFGLATDEDVFQHGVFGKGLFYARIHGSCTPSAILWTTVFRALGIPTRIVETAPPVDANDGMQRGWITTNIHDEVVKSVLVSGLASAGNGNGAWANHTFVEVYVGKAWVRLNYDNLGQKILDPHYFGLLTVVNRFNDWSESGLVDTWGRYVVGIESGTAPALSSVNPYESQAFGDE